MGLFVQRIFCGLETCHRYWLFINILCVYKLVFIINGQIFERNDSFDLVVFRNGQIACVVLVHAGEGGIHGYRSHSVSLG